MKQRNGYTLIELVLVLFLLILVAGSVFTLAVSGSRSYLRLENNQRRNSDMRIGLSYLDVKLRQNDRQGALEVTNFPGSDQSALRIGITIGDELYYTWIYVYDGYLREMFVPAVREFSPELGSKIIPAKAISFSRPADDALQIVFTVIDAEGVANETTRVFFLRSEGGGQ